MRHLGHVSLAHHVILHFTADTWNCLDVVKLHLCLGDLDKALEVKDRDAEHQD
jgi:hypothetical protein